MKEFLRCKDCKHDKGKCVGASRRGGHKNCFEKKIMTNGDRIRAMTDDELVDMLVNIDSGFTCWECTNGGTEKCPDDCVGRCRMWFRKPAEVQPNG